MRLKILTRVDRDFSFIVLGHYNLQNVENKSHYFFCGIVEERKVLKQFHFLEKLFIVSLSSSLDK